ncbi:hypothetical protein Avbf_19134, partial [Armadillidium vulgare]
MCSITNLVLRHPLSTKKESNDVNLPLNEMQIGWNRIYLNKNGRTVQVEIVKRNSQNFIQNITVLEGISLFLGHHIFKDPFHVSGLYSLVNCLIVDSYVKYDILKYNNSIFTTIVLHNTGDTDFYIEIDFWPPTNAPIFLLKGKFSLV